MDKKYVIKIYDRSTHSSDDRVGYFFEEDWADNTYCDVSTIEKAQLLTKAQAKSTVKKIEKAHKDGDNGILNRIEILNANTSQVVDFNAIKVTEEIKEIDRFELMDFD